MSAGLMGRGPFLPPNLTSQPPSAPQTSQPPAAVAPGAAAPPQASGAAAPSTARGSSGSQGDVNKDVTDVYGSDYKDSSGNARVSGDQKLYSVAFRVNTVNKDNKNEPCAGMYYTLKAKNENMVFTGLVTAKSKRTRKSKGKPDNGTAASGAEPATSTKTQDSFPSSTHGDGVTIRFTTTRADEIVYIYIGHRTDEDGYPESQDTDEHKHDEAPLGQSVVFEDSKKMIVDVITRRKWKPWTETDAGKNFTMTREGLRRNEYSHDGKKSRNVTIGIGILVHKGNFVMDQNGVTSIVNYLNENNMPITIDNIVNSVGPATGLTGEDLKNAQSEMSYINGITSDNAKSKFLNETLPNHTKYIEEYVFVPLYQYEYEALCDISYNRGTHIIPNTSENNVNNKSYGEWLNRGKYYYTGNTMIRNSARPPDLASRRDDEADLFLNGIYVPKKLSDLEYQPNNHTPWNHVPLSP